MAVTLLDLITEVMIDIAELAAGESPSAEDGVFIFGKTNEMLDSQSTEKLNIYTWDEIQLPLPVGKVAYEIGPGAADFDQSRPVKIEGANILTPIGNSNDLDSSPVDIIGEPEWRNLSDTTGSTGNIPSKLYPDYVWPTMRLNLYPAPKVAVATILQLSVWRLLQQFTALTDEFNMPYGYQAFFVANLRIVIKQAYGHTIDQGDIEQATTYKARIQGLNAQLPSLGLSNGLPAPVQ